MQRSSIWQSIRLAFVALGLMACAADPLTAPKLPTEANAGVIADLVGGLLKKDVLTRQKALPRDLTVAAEIGIAGGRLSIPAAGFELIVPPNAVRKPTRFTVTAVAGNLVAYEFGPHGTVFPTSLRAKQDLSVTNWNPLSVRPLTAGYFQDRGALNHQYATALVSEVIEGLTMPLFRQFVWPIDHFSGYVVAW
jgi:hypothetical protein